MKHLFNLSLAIMLLGSLAISCDKKEDDNTDSKKNFLKIGSNEYELSVGSLENYGLDTGEDSEWEHAGYNLDLTLFTKNFTLSTDADNELEVDGSGQVVYFEMFSSSGASLNNGEYNLDYASPYPIGTFDYSDYCSYWSNTNEENNWIEMSSGKVTVNKSGDIYEITINCKDETDVSISGYYKGTLKYYDYTSELKSAGKVLKKKR